MAYTLRRLAVAVMLLTMGTAAVAGDKADDQLLNAAEADDMQAVEKALDNGADVSARNDDGRTALILAARNASPEVVQALIEAGADVNAGTTASKKTAVMGAARKGHTEIVRILTEAGADVDSRDQNGRTALMVASKQGYHEIMTLLIDNGATVDTNDRFGWHTEDYAKMGGDKTVKHLNSLKAKSSDS